MIYEDTLAKHLELKGCCNLAIKDDVQELASLSGLTVDATA